MRFTAFTALRFRDLPIRQKIRLAIVGTTVVTLMLVIVAFSVFESVAIRHQIEQELDVRAQIIAANSVAALAFSDADAATETLNALRAAPNVQVGCIYIEEVDKRRLFAAYVSGKSGTLCPNRPVSRTGQFISDDMALTRDIELDGDPLGLLYIQADLGELWQRLLVVGQLSLFALIASVLFAFLLAGLLQRLIAGPLVTLSEVADSVSTTRDYSLRAVKVGNDEVGQLIDSFNDMLAQIDERNIELQKARDNLADQVKESQRANQELSRAMDQLRQTQNQLVQTEKMASLGGLVAGVAHEINTPVGVGVTAASGLKAKTEELVTEYREGKIRRSSLDEYTEYAVASTNMILRNLERAADLIRSFKQVAVDQSSSEKRRFALREYIDEVLLSLRPQIKKTKHVVIVECPDALVMNSFPGALSQVLTNLIMNSLIHAFNDDDTGQLKVDVAQDGDRVEIIYSDNGKGIPPEHHEKVFDPFFTTRRGSGGSGLGMHIVFNLVTTRLGGSIELLPGEEQGARFRIRIPIER